MPTLLVGFTQNTEKQEILKNKYLGENVFLKRTENQKITVK